MIAPLRLTLSVLRRIVFRDVPPFHVSDSLWFARIYGEMIPGYIAKGDESNAYVLAVRAFHHARRHLQ